MFVAHVDPGSPADTAGLQPGDLIVALDDKPVPHWIDLDQRLQAEPNKTFKLTWRRAVAGKIETRTAELTQVWRKQLDDYNHTVSAARVRRAQRRRPRARRHGPEIEGRFGYALSKAFERTGETISTMTSGFVQLARRARRPARRSAAR